MRLDAMVIGAHPDDAELGLGGLMHKLCSRGFRVGILDLTRGERSTRGTIEERAAEAANAAQTLGVASRENVGLPDGGVANVEEQQSAVATFIRRHRPRLLFIPMAPDRHPDHTAAHDLAKSANFFAGLSRFSAEGELYRAEAVYSYYAYTEPSDTPAFVFDISGHFEAKLEALRQHHSQFHNPEYAGEPTMVSSESFWRGIEMRAAYWGQRVGVAYGEPIFAPAPARLNLPLELLENV